jgi:hypothetical protein
MPADGTYTGVVDRFEGGQAVLLLEADGETVGERALDKTRLPEDGSHVDAVLRVELRDSDVVEVSYEPDETTRRSERSRRRFDELSSRPPSADDESDTESN